MGQPREVDIDMFHCPQELLESFEDLQYTVAELQSFYGDCEQRNQHLQQQLLDKEREFNRRIQELNEELSTLRNTKVRIARENIMKGKVLSLVWIFYSYLSFVSYLSLYMGPFKNYAQCSSNLDPLPVVHFCMFWKYPFPRAYALLCYHPPS